MKLKVHIVEVVHEECTAGKSWECRQEESWSKC